jgi:hypothetical protein
MIGAYFNFYYTPLGLVFVDLFSQGFTLSKIFALLSSLNPFIIKTFKKPQRGDHHQNGVQSHFGTDSSTFQALKGRNLFFPPNMLSYKLKVLT